MMHKHETREVNYYNLFRITHNLNPSVEEIFNRKISTQHLILDHLTEAVASRTLLKHKGNGFCKPILCWAFIGRNRTLIEPFRADGDGTLYMYSTTDY